MKNELIQDLIEQRGFDYQMDSIIETIMELGASLQKIKRFERKEDYVGYSLLYNDVCEKISEMKIATSQLEFLFNFEEINKHHSNKIEEVVKDLEKMNNF